MAFAYSGVNSNANTTVPREINRWLNSIREYRIASLGSSSHQSLRFQVSESYGSPIFLQDPRVPQ